MTYTIDDLETRTFADQGKWNWTVFEKANGLVLESGETHGGEGEAHLRAVHAANMLSMGYRDPDQL